MSRPDHPDASMPDWRALAELPRAFGLPTGRGRIRSRPEDFQVDEAPGFAPDGPADRRRVDFAPQA